jgi:hypothetical protein
MTTTNKSDDISDTLTTFYMIQRGPAAIEFDDLNLYR